MSDIIRGRSHSTTHTGDFEELINAIPALIARIDCNLRVLYANGNFLKWFPSSNGSSDVFQLVVGKPVFYQIQRHLGAVLTGAKAHFTIEIDRGDVTHYLDVTLTPQMGHQGIVKSIIFLSLDITEKLTDDRAFRDYFENASIALHWVNADGIIVWANPAELNLLGYSSDEYIGRHISEFHKSRNCIQDILRRLSNREILRNYEAELLCKDGSTRYVSINSSVLWEENRFVHTRCFTVDITAEKLASAAVQETEQRFRIMGDLVPMVILTIDENGLCTFLNNKWKELTGKEINSGLGDGWLEFVHDDDRPKIKSSWRKSLLSKSVFEAKFRILSANGHLVCFVNFIPRFDHANSFLGYTGIIQDVSSQEQITASLEKMVLDRTNDLARKNLELLEAQKALKTKNEQLEEINLELSSFAHVASHDLQEPLRKIQTFIDRLIQVEGSKLSENALNLTTKIERASARMRTLILDILSYSKMSNVAENVELVDFNQLLEEVVGEFEIKIEERHATIEFSGLPTLSVIRFQFHQLFLNLISNALKFSKKDVVPRIVIKSALLKNFKVRNDSERADFYHITVSDNGIGFESEYGDEIFEMFYRLHSRHHYEGTGIGLTICKKIVERHGGKISASGLLGEGATFNIYLPVNSNFNNEQQ